MRLITSLQKLEEAAMAAAERRRAGAVGLVWSKHETKIDPDTLEPGEYIAVDIRLDGTACQVVADTGEAGCASTEPACWWRVQERVTRDEQDLGVVRDDFGNRIGRVMEIEGSMLSIEMDDGAVVPELPAAAG